MGKTQRVLWHGKYEREHFKEEGEISCVFISERFSKIKINTT